MRNSLKAIRVGIFALTTTSLSLSTLFTHADSAIDSAPDITVDSHLHIVSPGNWETSPLKAIMGLEKAPTGENALEALNNSPIDKAVLVSTAYMFPSDRNAFERENNYIAEQVKNHPDKFLGLCGIAPLTPWALEEVDRCINKLNVNGLKLHLANNKMDLNNSEHAAAILAIFQKVSELKLGLPILIDFNWMDDSQTTNLMMMAATNPGVNIIMAHGLGHHYKELINIPTFKKLFKGAFENLYIDISATLFNYPPGSPSYEDYIWHLRQIGTDHILFGSDFPVETPQKSYEAFMKLGFSADEQKQILGGNAAKLFGITQ